MRVFGIGLNKTGTTTLGRALEILGFENHVTCDLGLTRHWKNNELDKIFEVADQNNNFEDWPWPLVYQELYDRYPKAKFILTTRKSDQTWLNSLKKHAIRTGPTEFREMIYGFKMPDGHETEHLDYYNTHNTEVRRFFNSRDSDRLLELCWENGDGWDKMCEFLNVTIPSEEFPRLNQAKDKNKYSGPLFYWVKKLKNRFK